MDFIFVSLQITVLFVLFFVLVGIVWLCLLPVTKCYEMNYCKYNMSFLKIHMPPFLSLITLILCYVVM